MDRYGKKYDNQDACVEAAFRTDAAPATQAYLRETRAVLKFRIQRILSCLLCPVLLTAMGINVPGRSLLAQDASSCNVPDDIERSPSAQSSVASHDLLGTYFAKQNRFPCAIAEFEQALRIDPTSWETHFDLGLALLASGQSDAAITQLENAAAAKSDNADIYLALGSAYGKLHNFDKATEEYRAALKAHPQSVPALMALGEALIAGKRYTAAINSLKGSSNEGVRRLLAEAYTDNGDLQGAKGTLQSLVNASPTDFQDRVDLGLVLQKDGDYGGAAYQFEQAMRLRSSDVYACVSYLNDQVILQQFAVARPVALDLLRRNPHDFSASYLVGLIDRDLGDYVGAEPYLREAVALDHGSYEAHYTLGFVLERLGEATEALEQIQMALQLNPRSTEARFQLGRLFRSLGRQEEAQKQFAVLQQEKEEETLKAVAGDRANAADRALKAGETQNAIRLYREAIAKNPKDSHAYYNLALALDRRGEVQAEREALEIAIERDSSFAPPHNQLGYLEMQAGHVAEAETQFKLSAAIDPQYAEADNNLGVLYGKLGRVAEAKRFFLRATENNPQYAQAFMNLSLVLASESNFSEADLTLREAIQLAPHDQSMLNAQKMIQSHFKQ